MMRASCYPHTLSFSFEAKTSRGSLWNRRVWYLRVSHETGDGFGLGECAPLPGLSRDDDTRFEAMVEHTLAALARRDAPTTSRAVDACVSSLVHETFPALRCGLEMALLDLLHGGTRNYFPPPLSDADRIPINALIWMGNRDFLLRQIEDKVATGCRCLKMKVDSHDFSTACEVLQHIRARWGDALTLRLDANGAFPPGQALEKLEVLRAFNIHSIEQPIAVGQWEAMAEIIKESPIPIALDEELIGVAPHAIPELLVRLSPHYLVLKPTLLGGFSATQHWIRQAQQRDIGWWITSALESNVGLYALAQFTKTYAPAMPQGLGTGQLYANNLPSPLLLSGEHLSCSREKHWEYPWAK